MPSEQSTGVGFTVQQQADYLSFLIKAVQEITGSMDYAGTLSNVAHAMVPKLSDWCAVDIMQEDGKLKRLATAHVDPNQIEKAHKLAKKYPRDPNADSGSPYVLKTGEPNMHNAITDDLLAEAAINEEHQQWMRELFYSLMIVPIKSRGQALGTMTLAWAESRRTYSLADLAFAETLASVAGSAIDNARLYKASRLKAARPRPQKTKVTV